MSRGNEASTKVLEKVRGVLAMLMSPGKRPIFDGSNSDRYGDKRCDLLRCSQLCVLHLSQTELRMTPFPRLIGRGLIEALSFSDASTPNPPAFRD